MGRAGRGDGGAEFGSELSCRFRIWGRVGGHFSVRRGILPCGLWARKQTPPAGKRLEYTETPREAQLRLAAARRALGLPPSGSFTNRYTIAILEADGIEIWGINAHGQQVPFSVNAISKSHAEIDALNQLAGQRARSGVTGGYATMFVDRPPCRACGLLGGIRSGVEAAGLDVLEVYYPGGSMTVTPRR